MSAQNQYKIKVKVNNNEDTRLWRNASPNDFEGLSTFITSTWNTTDFIAQYKDDEGDLITIASAQDLKDAFDLAIEENQKSLKIFVQSNIKPKQTQTSQTSESAQEAKAEPAEPEMEEKAEPKPFGSVHEMAFDFLTNARILSLLPEMFAVIIDKLVKKGSPLTVDQIIALVNAECKNEKFSPITTHALYVKYAVLAIPFIAQKIAAQQCLYPHFKLDTIRTWITQVLQMFGQAMTQMSNGNGLCAFKDIVIDIEYPSKTDTGKVIHFGVECDLCGEYPIIGDRYKCSICEDWDCCPKCEPKHSHPLIKFKTASKEHKNASFKGLSEIVSKLSAVNCEKKTCEETEVSEVPQVSDSKEDSIDVYDEVCVDCICGTKMECVIAKKAYNRCNTVYCDECGVQCFNEMIYHCPKNKDPIHHQNGYDLCSKCGSNKAEQDSEETVKEEIVKEEIVKEEVVIEPVIEPVIESVIVAYEYEAQLTQIKEILGWKESGMDESIKQMLNKHKGDVAKVVPLLLH